MNVSRELPGGVALGCAQRDHNPSDNRMTAILNGRFSRARRSSHFEVTGYLQSTALKRDAGSCLKRISTMPICDRVTRSRAISHGKRRGLYPIRQLQLVENVLKMTSNCTLSYG